MFVGGQVAELLVTDASVVRMRPTDDVDVVVPVTTCCTSATHVRCTFNNRLRQRCRSGSQVVAMYGSDRFTNGGMPIAVLGTRIVFGSALRLAMESADA